VARWARIEAAQQSFGISQKGNSTSTEKWINRWEQALSETSEQGLK